MEASTEPAAEFTAAAAAAAAAANREPEKSKDNCRVYAANLPPRVLREDLEEAFAKIGKVTGVWIANNTKYAFIDYESQEIAERAVVEMDKHILNGNTLRVEMGKNTKRTELSRDNKDEPRRRTARTKNRVVITGLGSSTSWQDLKDIMRNAGGDVTFTVVKNGEGFAEFGSETDVDRVISKLNDSEVNGQRVTVRRDELADRDLEQPPRRDDRRRRDHDSRRRRPRSRSPRRARRSSRERRRSRQRSPDDRSRRKDRDVRDKESSRGRRRDDSASSASGSRSPPRRRRGGSRSD
jgi:RNA recognition motif-containing protein